MTSLHDNAYLYVVGALSPDETAEFEEHQADCPQCRAEVAELRAMAAELSAAVAVAPPAALRSAVLSAIATTPQSPASVQPDRNGRGLTAVPSAASSEAAAARTAGDASTGRGSTTVVPLRRSAGTRLSSLLAAAAVFAALALGGWAWQDRQAAHDQARQATQQVAQLTELLSATDVKTVTGRGVASGTSGTVVLSPSRHQAVLVASSLPVLPDGRVYEAWTNQPDPVPAGTFTPDQAKIMVALPARALAAQSVAVTVEPVGGSAHPTTDAIFTVNIPQSA